MQTDWKSRRAGAPARPAAEGGFTLIELLIASVLLAGALLAIANMMPTGHTNITDAGKRTMALTAARQILEDTRPVPFDNLIALNNFTTNNPATLPDVAVFPTERDLARRWRYTLAGEGDGFTFSNDEKNSWAILSRGNPTAPVKLDGVAQVSVADPGCPPLNPGCQLREITVTISFPGRAGNIALATRVTRL